MAGPKGSKYYNIFLRYKISLSSVDDNSIIDVELFNVLNEIKNEGSIVSAAGKAGISFRKAWNKIKKAERMLGFNIVERTRGGASGGHSELSEEGLKLLAAYDELVIEFDKSIYSVTKKFFRTINA